VAFPDDRRGRALEENQREHIGPGTRLRGSQRPRAKTTFDRRRADGRLEPGGRCRLERLEPTGMTALVLGTLEGRQTPATGHGAGGRRRRPSSACQGVSTDT
jgi:hypothetical protein